jgi:hypothetical protein
MNEQQISLMAEVREIIAANPERHRQMVYLDNAFAAGMSRVPVSEIRAIALGGVPHEPEDPMFPVCGTRGCVAGWAVVMSAPKGALVNGSYLWEEGGRPQGLHGAGREALGLAVDQAEWLFCASRTHAEVLAALDYLPAHPGATWHELAGACGNEADEGCVDMDCTACYEAE